jgi:predicted phosphodiesterase
MVKEISRNVHEIELTYKSGQEFWFLLTSDRHWDNPDSDWEMQLRHMKQARERGAMIIDAGDFFCAMQGKYDKRSDKSKVRNIHQRTDYLDSLVNTAADFFAPYQDLFAVVGQGNHETAILKNHETNLTERFIERLNAGKDHKVKMGGYGGFIKFKFKNNAKGAKRAVLLHYFHGYGGGGPVTKGVIQSYRQAVYMPDPDVIISGHVHEQYIFPIEQVRLTPKGRIYQRRQYHVRIPTYKNEYKDGFGGWHIETGKGPKPIGAWWMKLTVRRVGINSNSSDTLIDIDFNEAR